MTKRSHRGSLTIGFILIVIGLIFLIENFYHPFLQSLFSWRLIARYWPVILVIIGLHRIHGYFTWKEIPPTGGKEQG